MNTVLDEPLIRWYLRELDKASLTLLRIRVGIFTRTEDIPLFSTFEESGIMRTECH